MSAEAGLDESADPQALIVADLPGIDATVRHLRALSEALERTGNDLRGIEVGQWSGAAADAFRARFDESPARWFDGADAFADAATAFEAFRRTVEQARTDAVRAAELHRCGVEASATAVREHDAAVAAFTAQQAAGTAASTPPELTDPGVPMLREAARILQAARAERDTAGAHAAQIVQVSAMAAPEPPGDWERAADDALDWVAEGDQYLTGIADGVLDIVQTARTLNPTDPANIARPVSYLENLNSMAAGTVHAALHPAEMIKSVTGTGWGSDPARALGRLVPDVALTALTAGSGGIVGAAERGVATSAKPGRHAPDTPTPSSAAVEDSGSSGGSGADRPPPKTEDSPDLPARATIGREFVGEERGQSPMWGGSAHVRYFDATEREETRVAVRDGRLLDVDGELFNSKSGGSWHSGSQVRSIFVMDGKGNMFVSNSQVPRELHHSSFLAGEPVAGAGEVTVVDGKVEYLSDRSGHYSPAAECLDQVIHYLRKEGMDLTGVKVDRYGR